MNVYRMINLCCKTLYYPSLMLLALMPALVLKYCQPKLWEFFVDDLFFSIFSDTWYFCLFLCSPSRFDCLSFLRAILFLSFSLLVFFFPSSFLVIISFCLLHMFGEVLLLWQMNVPDMWGRLALFQCVLLAKNIIQNSVKKERYVIISDDDDDDDSNCDRCHKKIRRFSVKELLHQASH